MRVKRSSPPPPPSTAGLPKRPRAPLLARANDAPDALAATAAAGPVALAAGLRQPRRVGPEQPGQVGDVVAGPAVNVTPGEVLAAQRKLDALAKSDPRALARLRSEDFPATADRQLLWALARPSGLPNLKNPLWTRATNDARAALVAYTQGVVGAAAQGLPLDDEMDAKTMNALGTMDLATTQALQAQPFPAGAPIEQRLQWAVAMTYDWDWTSNPKITQDPAARALVGFVNGVLSKGQNNTSTTVLASERRTLRVGDDTRVFALHTPKGTPPTSGWPTVLFFHGSFGGYAPEQNDEYQQLNALADAHGFQIAYPVGLPEDRADSQTGRGMLNWDPVGAGPGGDNDKLVFSVIRQLAASRGADRVDPSRLYVAGHSQGGFYTSDLVAAYPHAFAGAAVLGAGLGSIASQADLGVANRKTPTLLRVGQDDIHLRLGEGLAARFSEAGFGDAFRADFMPQRGHEVLTEDLEQMLKFFESQRPLTPSNAATLDGTRGEVQPRRPVYRDQLDLGALPAELAANPMLTRAVQALAKNPYLAQDGNEQTLTLGEWRAALGYLSTFDPQMQQQIIALRQFYEALTPPPKGALDLTQPLPPQLAQDPAAVKALQELYPNPALDLDGYPGLLSAEELVAAFELKDQLSPQAQAGLASLEAWFFRRAQPPPPGVGARSEQTLPGGTRLQSYPNSDVAVAKMKQLVAGLSHDAGFAALLAKTTLVISPPGQGLDVLMGSSEYSGTEGIALHQDVQDGAGNTLPAPAFVVREDSIRKWNLGAGHELLHLLRFAKGEAAGQAVADVWTKIGGVDGQPGGYPNSEEMFAYFGQWYLAGFGAQLQQVSPDAYALCEQLIGSARIDPGALTANDALTSLQSLMSWFHSGKRTP